MNVSPPAPVALELTEPRVTGEPSFAELAKKHPDAASAAQQFEAVFLKQLLSSVEKVSSIGAKSETQSAVVGSMMTGALSEQLSTAGGIGLSEVILRAMVSHLPEPTPTPSPPSANGPLSAMESAIEPAI